MAEQLPWEEYQAKSPAASAKMPWEEYGATAAPVANQVEDDTPPAEPTDPWLKSLTGKSPGSDADAYRRAKDAAERQRIEDNKRRGFSEGIGNRIVATLPTALAKGVQGLAEIPRQARLGSEAAISSGLQKIGVSPEKARKTASVLSFFNPAIVASASQDAFGQETETWKKIEEGQKYLEEHHAPASRGTKFTDPVTGKQFNAKIKDIASNPEMMTQVVAGELAPMLVQTALLKGAGGVAPKGIKAAVTAMAKDPRIQSMLAINAGRIFSSEFKEATEKGNEDLVRQNIEKYGVEPDEATRKLLEASAREKMVAPALAITVATAPIETAFEASWIGHMLEVEGGKGVLRKLGSIASASLKEASSEGLEAVPSNIIKKATYKPEMTLDDALTDIATNFIGGAVAGGSFHSAHTALSSIGSQPEEFYRKPINEEQHKIVLDNLKAQEARLQASGDVEAASRTNDSIKQVEAAQTNADVIKAVVPGAAFGKVGVLAEETIGSGIALGDRLGDPTITEHAIALRDELHGMVEERRALIDDLNAQANEAADIEDLNVAKQILREVNKSKREVEESFKTRVKELTARAESELGEHAKQTANSVIDQKLQEVQDAAQAREVGQDRVAERQQVGEGGLPAEAGSGDQLAEGGQVQQEEVATPNQDQLPANNAHTVTGGKPTLTDIVSPAQNDVQSTAFEAAKEQIRKDETLTPQQKNEAIRKAYDRNKADQSFKAYHGSGVSGIKQFDLRFAGSGEGVAEQGHGLYVSSNPDVAEYFRSSIAEMGGEAKDTRTIGAVYDVDVRGNERSFLDLDKKVSEQTSGVKRNLMKTAKEFTANVTDDMTGLQAYKEIAHTIRESLGDGAEYSEASKMASDALAKNGIPGNKYLEQNTSDDSGLTGTSYVLFDPSTATILAESRKAGSESSSAQERGSNTITAWHGSPARDIESFSNDYIGRGEGAQAYGAGMYFAQNEGIADWYRRSVTDSKMSEMKPIYPWSTTALEIGGKRYTIDGMINETRDVRDAISNVMHAVAGFKDGLLKNSDRVDIRLSDDEIRDAVRESASDRIELARDEDGSEHAIALATKEADAMTSLLDSGIKDVSDHMRASKDDASGAIYRVNIKGHENEFLDLDVPVSEQNKDVKSALYKASDAVGADIKDYMSGRTAYDLIAASIGVGRASNLPDTVMNALREGRMDLATSLLLDDLGVRGNKYRDAVSRGDTGDKSYNFVVFNPSNVEISGKWSNLKAALKEIGNPNNVNDITQVIPNFAKLTDAIVRDLVAMGKAKFENYWNKFKEYVDEGTLKHVEERYGWQARNAYAEALDAIRDGNVEDAGGRASVQEPTYRPASYFAEGIDGIRERAASVANGRVGDAEAVASSFHTLSDAVLFGADHQTHVDENGMGTIYVVDGDSIHGASENGGFFNITNFGDGRVDIGGITGPAGHGLATMAAAASLAQKHFGATEIGGYITSVGAFVRRGLYPSTRIDSASPDLHTTSVSDMINKVVDTNVSPDVLVHAFNQLQNGDNLGAYLAWNVARGTTGDVDFMAAGLDPFRAADDMIRAINAEKGYNRQTLSQALGIDFNSATPGDYYWGIMRAIKKLGSTVGDTSLKIRTKFNLSADVSKEIAKQIHEYKDVSKIKAVPDSMLHKKIDGVDRFIHMTEVGLQDVLAASDMRDSAIAQGVQRYGTKYWDVSRLWRKGDPSGGYKYSPFLWFTSPAVISLRDSAMRRVYEVGKAFVARIEKTKYNAREGVKLASEIDQDADLSRAVQQALVHGTLWEFKNEAGDVIGQGKVLSDTEVREMAQNYLKHKPELIDKAVESYKAMRGHMDALSAEIKKALKYQHDVHVSKLNDALKVERDPKLRSQMRGEIQTLNTNFKDMMRGTFGNAAYWPLLRLGEYKFDLLDLNGNRLAVCFTDNTDAVSIQNAIAEAALDSPEVMEAFKNKSYQTPAVTQIQDLGEARSLGGAIFDGSMAAWLSQATSLDPEYASKMRDLIAAASVGDTFRQRTKHRSGVPGWTHKAGASFQHLVNTSANMIANAYHAHEFSGAMEGMGVDVRGEEYDPNMEAYARDYVNDVRNPPFSNWASTATTLSYAWELMGNNVFAFVNKFQPWLVGVPRLGAMFGYRKASRAMGTAENLTWRHTLTQLGFGTLEDLDPAEVQNIIERLSDRKNFNGYKNPTLIAENVRHTLMQSLESGDLRPSLNTSLMATGEAEILTKMGAIKDAAMSRLGIMQARSEQMNRIQTIIAGAILGSEHGTMQFDDTGMYNTGDRSRESVARFAEYLNDITNMTSGRANTPLTSRLSGNATGFGRIAFQYKRMLFDMMGAMHSIGLMNGRGSDSNAKAVWEYAKPWMAEMIAGTAFAGPKATVLGLGLWTGGKALVSAICAAWDWPEEEVFNAASDRIVEIWSNFYQTQLGMSKENADDLGRRSLYTMLHGATNANGYGFDISNSVTPQLMMIPNNAKPLEIVGSFVAGAAGSRVAGVAEQFQKFGFTKEGFAAAGQKITPRAIQGGLEVAGLRDTQTGDVEGLDAAKRIAGFRPTKQAMNQELLSAKYDLKTDRDKLMTNLRKKQENIFKLDMEEGVNNDKKIDKLREEIDAAITKHNLRVEASRVGDKSMRINYARDIKPFGNVEKQRQRNEDIEGWQK